jgi:hypothetical protein
MYSKITNPKTGRKVSVKSRLGKMILRNYLLVLKGGASGSALPDSTAAKIAKRGELATAVETISSEDKRSIIAFLSVLAARAENTGDRNMVVKYDDRPSVTTKAGKPSAGPINMNTAYKLVSHLDPLVNIKYAKFQEGIQQARAIKTNSEITSDEKKAAIKRINLYSRKDKFLQALMVKLKPALLQGGYKSHFNYLRRPIPFELKTGVNADGTAVWERVLLNYLHETAGKDAIMSNGLPKIGGGGPGKRNIYMVRGSVIRPSKTPPFTPKMVKLPPFKLGLTNFRYIPNADDTINFYELH